MSLFVTNNNVLFYINKAAEFKAMIGWAVNKPNPLKDYINRGLSATDSNDSPRFVSFFVPKKFGTSEKKNMNHMGFHMGVFTVRSLDKVKDGNNNIYILHF